MRARDVLRLIADVDLDADITVTEKSVDIRPDDTCVSHLCPAAEDAVGRAYKMGYDKGCDRGYDEGRKAVYYELGKDPGGE